MMNSSMSGPDNRLESLLHYRGKVRVHIDTIDRYETILGIFESHCHNERLAQLACLLVMHSGSLFKNHLDRILQKINLSHVRFNVLAFLRCRNCPPSVGTLARMANVASPTMSVVLSGMVNDGLVERVLDHSDRRIIKIALLPHGELVFENARSSLLSDAAMKVTGLESDELKSLVQFLKKVNLAQ